MVGKSELSHDMTEKIPPRDRLLAAAAELFYRHGIKSVGVDAIAEAAATNKMTLYRHFASKDELVSQYLKMAARDADCCWARLEQAHPGDALAQLRTFIRDMADHATGTRGCPLVNAAVELPDKDTQRAASSKSTRSPGTRGWSHYVRLPVWQSPSCLADELNLMLEGARVTSQSVGPDGLRARVVRISEALIASHSRT